MSKLLQKNRKCPRVLTETVICLLLVAQHQTPYKSPPRKFCAATSMAEEKRLRTVVTQMRSPSGSRTNQEFQTLSFKIVDERFVKVRHSEEQCRLVGHKLFEKDYRVGGGNVFSHKCGLIGLNFKALPED